MTSHSTRDRSSIAKVAAVLFLMAAANNSGTQAQTTAPAPSAFHLLESTIDDVHAAFRAKRTTCRALVGLYLKRIEAYDKAGPG